MDTDQSSLRESESLESNTDADNVMDHHFVQSLQVHQSEIQCSLKELSQEI